VQLYTRVARRERQAAAAAGGGGGVGGGGRGVDGGGENIQWFGRSSFRPSPNVAPTSSLPVLCRGNNDGSENDEASANNDLAIETMRWGIHTSSPKLPFLINARSETAAALASFSRSLALPSGRGVLAVEGYYEWMEASLGSKKKQPYFVHRTDGKPMLLAVLIERGGERGGAGDASPPPPPLARFVVLTRAPPKVLRWLHDRAPCILPTEEMAREWLSLPKSGGGAGAAGAAAAAATKVLSEAGAAVEEASSPNDGEEKGKLPLLSWHPVTPEMGKTSYQREDASRDIRKGGIASLFGKAAAASTAVKKETLPPPSPLAVAIKEENTTSPLRKHLLAHSGVKREHKNTDLLTLQGAASTKKKKTKTTTTTPAPKDQRSLDAFFSPKQEKKEKT